MYIHEEIQQAVLPLLKKYDLELIDLIGEMAHAILELSVLNDAGIQKIIEAKSVRDSGAHTRYETLRKLNPMQFAELHRRNLAGENFDSMVDQIAVGGLRI